MGAYGSTSSSLMDGCERFAGKPMSVVRRYRTATQTAVLNEGKEKILSHAIIKTKLLICVMGWLLAPALRAETANPISSLLPPGIHLGMTEAELHAARPKLMG